MIKLCTLCEHPLNIIPTVNVHYCAHCDTAQCRKPTHRCGQCMAAAHHQYDWSDTDYGDVIAEEPEEIPHWQQALGYNPDKAEALDDDDDNDDDWDDGYGPIGVS